MSESSVLDELQPLLLLPLREQSSTPGEFDGEKSKANGKWKRPQGKTPVDKENIEEEAGSAQLKKAKKKKAKKDVENPPHILPSPKLPSMPPVPQLGPPAWIEDLLPPPLSPSARSELDLNIDPVLQAISLQPASPKGGDSLNDSSDDVSLIHGGLDDMQPSFPEENEGNRGVTPVDDLMTGIEAENMLLHLPFKPSDESLGCFCMAVVHVVQAFASLFRDLQVGRSLGRCGFGVQDFQGEGGL